jgi:formate dehydrogenase
MLGAEKLLTELQTTAGPGIRVVRAPCVGLCDVAPVAEVGHHYVFRATASEVLATAARGETEPMIPAYVDYDAYVKDGGY